MSTTNPRFHDGAGRPDWGPLGTPAQLIAAVEISAEAIAKRAYQKFVARGRTHGFDAEDWAAAERELKAEAFE